MITHYSLAERQIRDQPVDLQANLSALSFCNSRFVADVVSMDAGAYALIEITLIKDIQSVLSTQCRIEKIGRMQLGIARQDFKDLACRVHLEIVGRMRLSARIVSFDQYEDVPEIF